MPYRQGGRGYEEQIWQGRGEEEAMWQGRGGAGREQRPTAGAGLSYMSPSPAPAAPALHQQHQHHHAVPTQPYPEVLRQGAPAQQQHHHHHAPPAQVDPEVQRQARYAGVRRKDEAARTPSAPFCRPELEQPKKMIDPRVVRSRQLAYVEKRAVKGKA